MWRHSYILQFWFSLLTQQIQMENLKVKKEFFHSKNFQFSKMCVSKPI